MITFFLSSNQLFCFFIQNYLFIKIMILFYWNCYDYYLTMTFINILWLLFYSDIFIENMLDNKKIVIIIMSNIFKIFILFYINENITLY